MDGPWKVYFELNGKTNDEVVKFLQENVDTRSLWYIHPGGRTASKGPHCHGLIYDHRQTAETFRNKIKKCFNLVKQGSFAISNKYERGTVMTDEHTRKYITYMTKGQYDPLLNIGYDANEVSVMRSEWREPTMVSISGDLTIITKGEVKKVRMNQVTIARMAIEKYRERDHPLDMRMTVLIDIVSDLLKANGMSRNYRQVANILQEIQCEVNPAAWRSKILSML